MHLPITLILSPEVVSDFRLGFQMCDVCRLGECELRSVRPVVSESWSAAGPRRRHKHVCDRGEPRMTFLSLQKCGRAGASFGRRICIGTDTFDYGFKRACPNIGLMRPWPLACSTILALPTWDPSCMHTSPTLIPQSKRSTS